MYTTVSLFLTGLPESAKYYALHFSARMTGILKSAGFRSRKHYSRFLSEQFYLIRTTRKFILIRTTIPRQLLSYSALVTRPDLSGFGDALPGGVNNLPPAGKPLPPFVEFARRLLLMTSRSRRQRTSSSVQSGGQNVNRQEEVMYKLAGSASGSRRCGLSDFRLLVCKRRRISWLMAPQPEAVNLTTALQSEQLLLHRQRANSQTRSLRHVISDT